MKHSDTANRLINESSPYLQQHAYNPVDWYPWGKEAIQKAKDDDKPIIVSVGYSACHWCHVMERESFENEDIAKIMNENFICIKVDREERPDVDQIYMDAVQAMGIQGGWPMNVFLTPDQKPFYGGTYFPPDNWAQLLQNVANAFKNNRKELEESSEGFTESLSLSEVKKYGLTENEAHFEKDDLVGMFQKMALRFDNVKGGMDKAPKFPMPANWKFMARFYAIHKNESALKQLKLTLTQMAFGGIYDQIGGGFARYSVDAHWFAPHFEKMLYDNGQLVSLFSEAYSITKDATYQKIVHDTIGFVERELTSPDGGFYAALDADSEGEEGKFYVWSYKEFVDILDNDAPLMVKYYNVVPQGNWEHGNNILYKNQSDLEFSSSQDIEPADLQNVISRANNKLLKARSKRTRPGLDDKVLAAWNGLMLKGLCDAYAAFDDPKYLELALRNAAFIESKLANGKGLKRNYKNGKATIDAYLEDYAFVIEAYTALYQVTFDEKWIQRAADLTDYTIENFYDTTESLFFYTDKNSEKLIARKKEIFDNVIPSSNSTMASNLYFLGIILDNPAYKEISENMVAKASKLIKLEPSYLSNWASHYANLVSSTAEVAIIGSEAEKFRRAIEELYYPNKVVVGAKAKSTLPLLESRTAINNKTTIYVCYNKTCKLPVYNVADAISQLAN